MHADGATHSGCWDLHPRYGHQRYRLRGQGLLLLLRLLHRTVTTLLTTAMRRSLKKGEGAKDGELVQGGKDGKDDAPSKA